MMFDISNETWTAQKINYFLCRWYLLEREISTNDANTLALVKSFFFRLSYLTDQQRDLLAYMYYHPGTKQKHTIKETAKHFNITASKAQYAKTKIIGIMSIPRKYPKGVKPTDNAEQKPNLLNAKELARNKTIHELFEQLQAFHSDSDE